MPTYSPAPVPVDPSPLGWAVGAGLAGFLLAAVLIVVGFVLSAWLWGAWLRLLVRFHRGWFDREYARVRGSYMPPPRSGRRARPHDWGSQGPTFFS